MTAASAIAGLIFMQLAIIGIGYLIERARPVEHPDQHQILVNLAYLLPLNAVHVLLRTITGVSAAFLVNAIGGGFITLPATGMGLLISVPVYTFAMDCAEYWFHRAQHRFPPLWALHSLHHSDPGVNVSTTQRHFWGDRLLKDLTIYALVGVIFKADAAIIGIYSLIAVYNYALHMNIRMGFGRWSRWLNSPQFHRLHHSALPVHHDCNFAQFFPIFDIWGGTFRQPGSEEYPPTGLDTGEVPRTLGGLVLWPWRRLLPISGSDKAPRFDQ